ncbi:MAG: hypothetical protein A2252_10720 [Elusimicrobia bacterium RIFOXYA2_FULL_39_19]|nr:MAG: hypothetical protein A2252_10720 [Elusimicrobia bacterium RIFOXYA2_FULL_39_19]
METSFTKYFNKALRYFRPFDWVNVEITSKCNLKCTICPRRSFKSCDEHMTRDLFLKIAREFGLFKMVDLTGWGEPLLHPDIFEFIKKAKDKKCIVKFTTNGQALDEAKTQKLVELGVDWMAFSVDGATEETYKKIRGASLEKLLNNIERLNYFKEKYSTGSPLIDIAIVINKQNLEDLPKMVQMAKDLKAHRLLVNQQHVVSREEEIDLLLYKIDEQQCIDVQKRDNIVKESRALAQKLGVTIEFCFKSFEPQAPGLCPLNIEKTMFISWDGNVSPCCDLGHPVPGVISRNKIIQNTQLVIGNVNNNTIKEIFNSSKYKEFRKISREAVASECRHCMLLRGI